MPAQLLNTARPRPALPQLPPPPQDAHALLQLNAPLGELGDLDSANSHAGGEEDDFHVDMHRVDSKDDMANEEAMDAVVMRYVRGTLHGLGDQDHHDNNSRKRPFQEELSGMSDFPPWSKLILDDDEFSFHGSTGSSAPGTSSGANASAGRGGSGEDGARQPADGATPPTSQAKAPAKDHHLHHVPHHDTKRSKHGPQQLTVDPELALLAHLQNHHISHHEGTLEHEQLVQAAIMDARELASQLGPLSEDYMRNSVQYQRGKAAAGGAAQSGRPQQQRAVSASPAPPQQPKPSQAQDQANPSPVLQTEVAALVAAAANRAREWVQHTKTHGKLFSEEEIAALDGFVSEYCSINRMSRDDICQRVWSNERKKDDFWEALQKVLPHRLRASVYKHVRRLYHVFEVRGKWTQEEDAELARLAVEKNGQWKIVGHMMRRMPEDCRDRWRNYIKCGANRTANKWSDEEEEKLREVVTQLILEDSEKQRGGSVSINWTRVSEMMGGIRLRIQCRYKWNKILKRRAHNRAALIGLADRVWMLLKVKELQYARVEDINWEQMARAYAHDHGDKGVVWSLVDFQVCFDRMRQQIRDFKKKPMDDMVLLLFLELLSDSDRQGMHQPLVPAGPKKEHDLAGAAVAVASASLVDDELSRMHALQATLPRMEESGDPWV